MGNSNPRIAVISYASYPSASRQVCHLHGQLSPWPWISPSRAKRRCLTLFRSVGSSYRLKGFWIALRNFSPDSIYRQPVAVQVFFVKLLGLGFSFSFIPVHKMRRRAALSSVIYCRFEFEKSHTHTIPNSWVCDNRNLLSISDQCHP